MLMLLRLPVSLQRYCSTCRCNKCMTTHCTILQYFKDANGRQHYRKHEEGYHHSTPLTAVCCTDTSAGTNNLELLDVVLAADVMFLSYNFCARSTFQNFDGGNKEGVISRLACPTFNSWCMSRPTTRIQFATVVRNLVVKNSRLNFCVT